MYALRYEFCKSVCVTRTSTHHIEPIESELMIIYLTNCSVNLGCGSVNTIEGRGLRHIVICDCRNLVLFFEQCNNNKYSRNRPD